MTYKFKPENITEYSGFIKPLTKVEVFGNRMKSILKPNIMYTYDMLKEKYKKTFYFLNDLKKFPSEAKWERHFERMVRYLVQHKIMEREDRILGKKSGFRLNGGDLRTANVEIVKAI